MTTLSTIRRLLALAALTAVAAPLAAASAAATGPRGAADPPARTAASPRAGTRAAGPYVPGRVIVGLEPGVAPGLARDIASLEGREHASGGAGLPAGLPSTQVVSVPRGQSVTAEAAFLRRLPGVAYAVPDYMAHTAGEWYPDDRGRTHTAAGWTQLQWNFLPAAGIDVTTAWGNLFADGAPGGRGVTVAIVDTGVAFENWHGFHASPDFTSTSFVSPCDLVAGRLLAPSGAGRSQTVTSATRCSNPNAVDREGHGTFVAGLIAESTNNSIGLTGAAYGASIMPVRVLDAEGNGDSYTIAQGIRYAVTHGARVINLSLEFDLSIGAGDIPDVIQAIDFAARHNVIVVAASGNDDAQQIAYPARDSEVLSVGATTLDRCLAAYSNTGSGLDLVAPGGGDDATLNDPSCHPDRSLPDIYQMTFGNPSAPNHFGLPSGWYGTSMAAPHVAAVAALVIASGVLGADPTGAAVVQRLEQTAQPLGGAVPNANYGYGLVDAGTATAGVSQIARSAPRSGSARRADSVHRTGSARRGAGRGRVRSSGR